jgi:hypothetical protein
MPNRLPDMGRDATIRWNRTNEELNKSYQWINHKEPYLQLEVNDIQWVHVTSCPRGIDNVCATRGDSRLCIEVFSAIVSQAAPDKI